MIELIVGMIGSGKSTYCNKRAKEGALIVNDDSIVMAVHGGNYGLYDKTLKHLYKGIENLIIHSAVASGRDVVIDRPNLSASTRKRYIEIANSLDQETIVTCFPINSPEYHASLRFKKDNRGRSYEYWLKAATFHLSGYGIPEASEGYSIIRNIDTETGAIINAYVRSKQQVS